MLRRRLRRLRRRRRRDLTEGEMVRNATSARQRVMLKQRSVREGGGEGHVMRVVMRVVEGVMVMMVVMRRVMVGKHRRMRRLLQRVRRRGMGGKGWRVEEGRRER